MNSWRQLCGWGLVLAATAPALPNLARAQDDVEVEKPVVAQPQFIMARQQFDAWAFGTQASATTVGEQLRAHLTLEIDDLERSHTLTKAQRRKLELAGERDIRRFFDRIDAKRSKLEDRPLPQDKMAEINRELRTFQTQLHTGLFGTASFFVKALNTTVSPEQLLAYEKARRERSLYHYRAKIDLATMMMAEAVGLSAEKQKRLADVLLEKTRMPKWFGHYDVYVVLSQAAKLPETTIRPIFDDAQWPAVKRIFAHCLATENNLKASGLMPGLDGDPDTIQEPIVRKAVLKPARILRGR